MSKSINAVITGITASVPDYILTNEELSQMVDTTNEWIMSRVGIKERRILKGDEQGISVLGIKAVKELLVKTNTKPEEVDGVIFATSTPDHPFPSSASIVAESCGIKTAFCFDMQVACSGFIYGLEVVNNFIKSGNYKKIILISGDKMSSVTNYTDRTTCPLFGDGCGAAMIEPTEEDFGIMDSIIRSDGVGYGPLQMKAGGSKYPASTETIANNEHTVYQEGKTVYKYAVSNMSQVSMEIMERNGLTNENLAWFVPHQANVRIIDAAVSRAGVSPEKVMVNIQKYGNTSAGTIPICLWEWEDKLKKGDNIILTAFGAGFSWGSIYLKWGYDGKRD